MISSRRFVQTTFPTLLTGITTGYIFDYELGKLQIKVNNISIYENLARVLNVVFAYNIEWTRWSRTLYPTKKKQFDTITKLYKVAEFIILLVEQKLTTSPLFYRMKCWNSCNTALENYTGISLTNCNNFIRQNKVYTIYLKCWPYLLKIVFLFDRLNDLNWRKSLVNTSNMA